MSWMKQLGDTYENFRDQVGVVDEKNRVLLPLSHLTILCQIEVTLDEEGHFLGARQLKQEEAKTIVPVTEDAASRSSGNTPMPLCDKLEYVAGDYDASHIDVKKKISHYDKYMEQLATWVNSPFSHPDVEVIYHYLQKRSLISDLKEEEAYRKPSDCVRFRILRDGKISKGVWENREIQDAFQKFYMNTLTEKGIDYGTGEYTFLTSKLPAKIRHSGDKAKIISSNDSNTNIYTFKGRFHEASDAVGIGYETSQKAHNALRWLIEKQGYRNDSETIVCWSTGGEEIQNPVEDLNLVDDLGVMPAISPDTQSAYAKKVRQAIAGYRARLDTTATILIMSLDTADGSGQGRLSITGYAEMSGSEYYHNLETWYRDLSWGQYKKFADGRYHFFVGSPIPTEIVLAAYGTEQEGKLSVPPKLVKSSVRRILPCIIQGKRLPYDLIRSAVNNVSNPLRFSTDNWERILSVTCALLRKYQLETGRKDVFDLALNMVGRDRDYLFGRLLAVAEYVEEMAELLKENNKHKTTNARRYWNAFVQKPAKNWVMIYERLNPYFTSLYPGTRVICERWIGEIMVALEETGGFTNDRLKENYLMGYYSQRAELRRKHTKNHTDKQEFRHEEE